MLLEDGKNHRKRWWSLRVSEQFGHQVDTANDDESAESCIGEHDCPLCDKDPNAGIISRVIYQADADDSQSLELKNK